MALKESICEALTEYARAYGGLDFPDDAVVVDFEEATQYGGYCETCSYEETVITLTLENGGTHTLYTTLADLVRSF